MRSFKRFLELVTCIFFLGCLSVTFAAACPDGQSEGAFGWCYPNVGGTVGQTFEAAKKGDWNTVAKGVGDVVITYNCPACAVFAQAVMNKDDRAIISTIVGRGVILSSLGVPTELIVADAATGVAQAIQLKGQSPSPIPQPAPVERGKKIYKSTTLAACIVVDAGNTATIGWITAPVFIEKTTGQSSTFPEIDLQPGDIVSSSASACPEYEKTGQKSISEVALIYENSQTVPGPAERMKFFIWGKTADLSIVAADK